MTSTLNLKNHVRLYDLHPPLDDFRVEVLEGLSQPEKAISAKLLYDKRGAELFDAICQLEEYYLTRTEVKILQTYAAEMAVLIGNSALIEFGSGSSQKIRILLDAMPNLPTYIALDISKQHLWESCHNLVNAYPGLEAIAICTDYTQPLQLPKIASIQHKRKVAFFPGSSIGNLEPEEAVQFLKNTAHLLGHQGGLLIGVDLQKDATILEPAYDDAQGVSAEFALNLLVRINRELGADFELSNFGYRAFYNSSRHRIEMYVESHSDQIVQIDGVKIPFRQGERLRTEYSYKYSISQFQELAALAGFKAKRVWTDPDHLFSVHYLQVDSR